VSTLPRRVAVLACGLALAIAGCTARQGDPRAYPDSRHEPLTQTLAKFALDLPNCDLGNFRYFATDDLQGAFFFRATVSPSCAERYLTRLGMDNDPAAKTGVSFIGTYEKDKFGWRYTGPQPCACYQRNISADVQVSLDIADEGDTKTLYLKASRHT
jgi:hypothetical protein